MNVDPNTMIWTALVLKTGDALFEWGVGEVASRFLRAAQNPGETPAQVVVADRARSMAAHVEGSMAALNIPDEALNLRLAEPSFVATARMALALGITTEDDRKRRILASIVVHRLMYAEGDLFSLATQAAIQAAGGYDSQCLGVLGLAFAIREVMPFPPERSKLFRSELFEWWDSVSRPLLQSATWNQDTSSHLLGTGALYPTSRGVPLRQWLQGKPWDLGHKTPYLQACDAYVDEVGGELEALWSGGLYRRRPTPVGRLIGFWTCNTLVPGFDLPFERFFGPGAQVQPVMQDF